MAKILGVAFVFCVAMAIASPAQTLTTLVNFAYTNGAEPLYESLVPGPDGNLYGTTNGAGAHNGGIVFKMTPSGTLTVLYSFCGGSKCTDGNEPDTGLKLGSDGNFYGVTTAGGASGDGTVFKITPSGDFTLLHTFTGSDGAEPQGALALASDGNFYGTTTSGGSHDFGTPSELPPAVPSPPSTTFALSAAALTVAALLAAWCKALTATYTEQLPAAAPTFSTARCLRLA